MLACWDCREYTALSDVSLACALLFTIFSLDIDYSWIACTWSCIVRRESRTHHIVSSTNYMMCFVCVAARLAPIYVTSVLADMFAKL